MIKKHLLGGALLVSVLVLLTGCKEMMSSLDNPVSAYFEVTPTQATIAKNQTCQISYSTISDGKVTFKSSAENIATVDANGLVTAKTAGTAIITVELAATPYYQGATKNVEISVDAVLSIDATEVTVGYGASINLVKDYHLARKGDATINYEIIEGGEFITLDETTKDITGKACGNAKVKVSVPASVTASSDELIIDVKVRVQDFDQLKDAIASGDEVTALLDDNVEIALSEVLDLKDKKITIKGNDEKPATIAVSSGAYFKTRNAFKLQNVIVDGSNMDMDFVQVGGASEAPSAWTDLGTFVFENVKVNFLKKALIKSIQKKYAYDLTVNNCIIQVSANVTVFDFSGSDTGNIVKTFTIDGSTIYGSKSVTKQLYSSQSGYKVTELGSSEKQTFAISNSTFYNLTYKANFFNHRQSNQTFFIYDVKSNIFVNCGKKGQTIKGLNQGSSGTNPTWIISGNVFNHDDGTDTMGDTHEDESTGDAEEPVTGSIAGVVSFADAANGDFHQTLAQVGDPRWRPEN